MTNCAFCIVNFKFCVVSLSAAFPLAIAFYACCGLPPRRDGSHGGSRSAFVLLASDSSLATFLRYYVGELGPLHGYHRSCGFSVRCVQASAATACRRNRKKTAESSPNGNALLRSDALRGSRDGAANFSAPFSPGASDDAHPRKQFRGKDPTSQRPRRWR